MAQQVPARGLRAVNLGAVVQRLTATLPATAAQNIFTVTGGRILLTGLIGEVTTIIQAQATTIKFTHTPTTGSAVDLTGATTDLNALEVGGKITLPQAVGTGNQVVKVNAAYAQVGPATPGVCLAIGSLSYTTGATSTGSIKWTAAFIPLDDGAALFAA